MLFNSFDFLIFFPIVVGGYFWIAHQWRWLWLLAASCYFYMSFIPVYILILLITIVIDYWAGIYIERTQGKTKKMYLVISIIATCLVLFVFKYFNFFNANMTSLVKFLHWNYPIGHLSIILPIGLSFHTFQNLSYVIEVYRGHQKAEKNFGIYALYVMFFPQLVAGPIERPQNLLHQFYEKHHFDYDRVTDGLKLMLWGFFKKIVIADRLALLVNTVYDKPSEFAGLVHIVAAVLFTFQVYCDFSGYSDIAIGAAQVMGFKLMDNFNRPFFSKSVAEFWKRWHISLSTWFKDYLYISLGGNRVSKARVYFNVLVTFIISGLWHGANWTFIVWGALNGFYLVFSMITKDIRQKWVHFIRLDQNRWLHKFVSVGITFSLTCFSFIFFRASTLTDAVGIIQSIGHALKQVLMLDPAFLKPLSNIDGWGLTKFELGIVILMLGFMEYVHVIQRHSTIRHMLREKPIWFRWSVYYSLIFAVIVLGNYGRDQFIYFQF